MEETLTKKMGRKKRRRKETPKAQRTISVERAETKRGVERNRKKGGEETEKNPERFVTRTNAITPHYLQRPPLFNSKHELTQRR